MPQCEKTTEHPPDATDFAKQSEVVDLRKKRTILDKAILDTLNNC